MPLFEEKSYRLYYHTGLTNMQTSCAIWIYVWMYTKKVKITNIQMKLKIATKLRSENKLFKLLLIQAHARIRSGISDVTLHWKKKNINRNYIFIAL